VNYLMDAGAYRVGADGTFSVDMRKARKAVEGLSRELLTIQAKGDYDGGKRLMERLVVLRPEVQAVLARLDAVPVDIRPRFVTADELEREFP
jgi:hypothetical protein